MTRLAIDRVGTFWSRCGLLVLAIILLSAPSLAQERHVLRTHVARPRAARAIGPMPASQRLNLALTLALRNQSQLSTFVEQLYDPTSPNYHHFLTVQQFTDQFGPTIGDYQKAISFAEKYGLRVTNTTPNRLVLDVSGTIAQINQAFGVNIEVFQHPTENRTFHAPDREPSVEEGVLIQGVNGLNNIEPPRPMGLKRQSVKQIPRIDRIAHGNQTVHTNQTGSFCLDGECFFIGSDMRAAYAPGTALTGAGQAVGLFEFGPFNVSDVENYFALVGQPLDVPIVTELLDGVSGICGAGCDDGEEAIDMEQTISMAPGLSAVIVYEGTDDTDMFNQMATDDVAKSLNCSFGFLPADPSSDEPIFMEFALQGQNLFVASGDGGAYFGNPTDCQNFSNLNGCVFYPADDPYITAAGGTDLTTSGAPAESWVSETGWIGSGGGFATNGYGTPVGSVFPTPSYQLPAINSLNQGSTTARNIPDVAAESNTDNLWCSNGGCFAGVGGTSLSAPRWAGFLALSNQQADGVLIGFLNRSIYSIGLGPNYNSAFHDIIVGDNFNSGSPDLFSAVAGYDLVTGWGSPNGSGLLDALGPVPTGPNFELTASPSTLKVTQGNTGTSTISLSVVNGFSGNVSLTVLALGSPAGVTASLSTTTLNASTPSATLSVSTTDVTPGGNFLIAVSGTSGGLTHITYVTLALPGFSISTPGSVFINQGSSSSAAITITPINGFTGRVSFSLSGLPDGVFAFFYPNQSATGTTLNFSAFVASQTGPFSITITGKSGKITQMATITLEVSAATGPGGFGLQVNLSPAYNVTGIYTDGSTFSSSGGLDGGGAAYSRNALTPSRVLDLVRFVFGPANAPDAVSATGSPVALPRGHFERLVLLATGVQGSQSENVTITYTDGTTQVVSQSFSDWFVPQNFPNEIIAVAMPYRDIFDGSQDDRTFNLYAYRFRLDPRKTVKSFSIANNRDVVVLAATLF
jgi:subtilase family serine protease